MAMTKLEAIKRLETCDECGDCLTCAEHDEALRMAIAALREQESAKNAHCKTNADHIRSMTDEELVKRNVHKTKTPVTGFYGYGESYTDYYDAWVTSDGSIFWTEKPAVEYELHWLKQPYKEDT